jgi:hypothetical protein
MACSSEDPREAALHAERALIAGDALAFRALLSRDDSTELAKPEAAALAQVYSAPSAGRAATTVDSARVVRRAGDSATVAVFLTTPNWESVGGALKWDGTSYIDRSKDPEFAKGLPRVTEVDSVRLVRERRGMRSLWRLATGVRKEVRLFPLSLAVASQDSSISARAAAARAYRRETAALGVQLDPATDSILSAATESGGLADSVTYRVELRDERSAQRSSILPIRVAGYVVNRSRRALALVEVRAVLTSGEVADGHASNIAPGDSSQIIGYGNWRGRIVRHAISRIEPAR